ncbi:MAG: hypothetical protein NVS4B2_18020 [Chloroflexota bacterium]
MKILSFGPGVSHHVTHIGSDFTMSRLIHNHDLHVACMRLEPGGSVGYHPTATYQLFAVVEGAGWVRAGDADRVSLTVGEAAFWDPGEGHEAGTETGMTAIVVEGDVLGDETAGRGAP